MSTSNSSLDPYTAKAVNTNITPQEKINDLHKITKTARAGMLTTHCADGRLHSRAMTPASPFENTQLSLVFLANNASSKFDEIENDANVNVSFSDPSSTNWASYSGKARISQDRDLIKKYWSNIVSAYFGDLKDGVHKGNEEDPRVAVIEVIPDEIRYWYSTQGSISRTVTTAVSATTGHSTAPGEIRIITKEEIQLTQGLHAK